MSLMMIPGDSDRPHYAISCWWERGVSMCIATETPQNEMVLHPKEIQKRSKNETISSSHPVFFFERFCPKSALPMDRLKVLRLSMCCKESWQHLCSTCLMMENMEFIHLVSFLSSFPGSYEFKKKV